MKKIVLSAFLLIAVFASVLITPTAGTYRQDIKIMNTYINASERNSSCDVILALMERLITKKTTIHEYFKTRKNTNTSLDSTGPNFGMDAHQELIEQVIASENSSWRIYYQKNADLFNFFYTPVRIDDYPVGTRLPCFRYDGPSQKWEEGTITAQFKNVTLTDGSITTMIEMVGGNFIVEREISGYPAFDYKIGFLNEL